MFNVYKNQLSRQTGSRNLTGPKTLPTIWYTYMMPVTKYQISAINSYWEKCDEKYLGRTEGQTDRRKTVYPPPPLGSGGIIIPLFLLTLNQISWFFFKIYMTGLFYIIKIKFKISIERGKILRINVGFSPHSIIKCQVAHIRKYICWQNVLLYITRWFHLSAIKKIV
jgi:hypothetical protein